MWNLVQSFSLCLSLYDEHSNNRIFLPPLQEKWRYTTGVCNMFLFIMVDPKKRQHSLLKNNWPPATLLWALESINTASKWDHEVDVEDYVMAALCRFHWLCKFPFPWFYHFLAFIFFLKHRIISQSLLHTQWSVRKDGPAPFVEMHCFIYRIWKQETLTDKIFCGCQFAYHLNEWINEWT